MISNEDLSHVVSARIEKRNRKCGGEVRFLETAEWWVPGNQDGGNENLVKHYCKCPVRS